MFSPLNIVKIVILQLVLVHHLTIVTIEGVPVEYSRCPNMGCIPSPAKDCWPTYDREDGCYPVWHCVNEYGQSYETYGKMGESSSSSSSFSSSSFSSSLGGGGGNGIFVGNPFGGSVGGFGFPNFANLFG